MYSKFIEYPYIRDMLKQRGYTFDDIQVHHETDLRRSPFYEHVFREATHPYHWLFFKARRRRYFKVDRIINGFFVPDYVNDEVKNNTLAEALVKEREWDNFIYKNYVSDITNTSHAGQGIKMHVWELFSVINLFEPEAWKRHFYNESTYGESIGQKEQEIIDNPLPFDLETDSGRREFEQYVNKIVHDFPGALTVEGEAFNFTKFYASRAIAYGKDTSKFDSKVLEDARAKLEQSKINDARAGITSDDDPKVGTSSLGTVISKHIVPDRKSVV